MSNTDPNQTIVVPANTTTQPPPVYVSTTDTNNGFITGVDPATGRRTAQPTPQPTAPSADEVAAAVGDKINPVLEQQGQTVTEMQQRMEAMQTEIDTAREAREAAEAAAAEQERQRLAAEQAVEEEKLSATELVAKVRGEMQSEFDTLRAENAAKDAILEQERRFNALSEYRANRLSDPAIASSVMPHLHQYINGNSEQEIEDAIARAAQTTAAITQEVAEYNQSFRQGAIGVSPAAPTAGPMEVQQSQQTMSAEQIAALNPAEYARLRPALLRAAGQAFRGQGR